MAGRATENIQRRSVEGRGVRRPALLAPPDAHRAALDAWRRRLAVAGLAVAMAVGSLGLWTILPVTWLWLASNIVQSNMFSYIVALIGCPLSMVQAARGLYVLQDHYSRLREAGPPPVMHTGWLRSISGERRSLTGLTLLDWLMIASAVTAVVTLVVYYFFLSHPLVVTGPQAPGNEHALL